MKSRKTILTTFILGAAIMAVSATASMAQQVECTSQTRRITGVANPLSHYITTRYQLDTPNLQPLMSKVFKSRAGCVTANLSGLTRITDNYVVFQVRVDGVPMAGHLPGYGYVETPVVFVSIDSGAPPYDDEQYINPTKVFAYNFVAEVDQGLHTIEVFGAAGSNIVEPDIPTVSNLVLTMTYH